MIDVHCHILPGVDDGAADLDSSRAMLRAAKSLGITAITATPHLQLPLAAQYEQTVADAYARLKPYADELEIALDTGYEVQLSTEVPTRLRAGDRITMAGTSVVLVDLPFTTWPDYVDDTIFNIVASGYLPILAHPERYPTIQNEPGMAEDIARHTIPLQMNIGSLAGTFGKTAKKTAEELLRRGCIHLVATDAHSPGHRMAAVPAGLRRLEELVGQDGVERLTRINPARILQGEPAPEPVRVVKSLGIRRFFLPAAMR